MDISSQIKQEIDMKYLRLRERLVTGELTLADAQRELRKLPKAAQQDVLKRMERSMKHLVDVEGAW